MGIALKVPGIDFSGANLGKVHPVVPGSLNSISITGSSSVYGTAQYGITYDPADTLLVGVVWSIDSGGTFATIDQNGLLTAQGAAVGESVRIKAVSAYDPTITATKDVVVYQDARPTSGIVLKDVIQTGITAPAVNTLRCELRYYIRWIGDGYVVRLGARNADSAASATDMVCVSFPYSGDTGNVMLGAARGNNPLPKTEDTDYIVVWDGTDIRINGQSYPWTGSVGSATPSRQLWIGNMNQPNPQAGPSSQSASIVINYFRIYSNDELFCEFIPYYAAADDFGYLETISKTKFNIYGLTDAEFVQDYNPSN